MSFLHMMVIHSFLTSFICPQSVNTDITPSCNKHSQRMSFQTAIWCLQTNNNPSNRPNNVTIHHPHRHTPHNIHITTTKTQLVIFPPQGCLLSQISSIKCKTLLIQQHLRQMELGYSPKTSVRIFTTPFNPHNPCGILKNRGLSETFKIMQLCPSCGNT